MTLVDGVDRDALLPGPGEAWTPIRLTRWSGQYLRGKGIESGRLDSELLLAQILNVARLDLYLQFDRPLRPAEMEAFKALLRRRAAREPLQYVLGSTTFREIELKTDPRALIPRPETEILVGEVLAWAEEKRDDLRALDIGVGSGAIALSLLKEGSFSVLVGTDTSREALALAGENATAAGLSEKLDLREGHLYGPLEDGERFDIIVSNPPYVPEDDRSSLEPEVLDWEPAGALFAGPEGLDVLLPLARGAREFLVAGGLFAAEVGDGQGNEVARILGETGAFREVSLRPDLNGRGRVVLAVAGG